MTIQQIITKIEKEAERERKIRPRVTLPEVKFVLTMPVSSTIEPTEWMEDVYVTDIGFIDDEDWRTAVLDIEISTDSKGIYRGNLYGKTAGFALEDETGSIISIIYGPSDLEANKFEIEIPYNTRKIYCSYWKNGIVEFDFTLLENKDVDVTPYVANANTTDMALSRSSLSGVFVSVPLSYEYTLYARDLIEAHVKENGLYNKPSLTIYARHDNNNEYDLIENIILDMETYQSNDSTLSVECEDNSLESFLRATMSSKFDIPVADIKSSKKWHYERINLLNSANYTISENPIIGQNGEYYLFVMENNSEIAPGTNPHDFRTQESGTATTPYTNYFFRAMADLSITVNLNFTAYSKFTSDTEYVKLLRFNGSDVHDIKQWNMTEIEDTNLVVHIDEAVIIEDFPAGWAMALVITSHSGVSSDTTGISDFREFNVRWIDKGPAVDVDVIDPQRLLQELFNRTARIKQQFTAQIEWEEDVKLMLCAAETLRGFNNAVLHTSIRDFMDWMDVFGYEYTSEDNKMVWRSRKEFYKQDITTLTLDKTEVARLSTEVSNDFLYSNISAGYAKQDYESVNGRFELNGKFEYLTGYMGQTTKELSMISPYRGDSVGIDLLVRTQQDATTDNKSDNDVFVVALQEEPTQYITDVTIEPQIGSVKLFNGIISPYYIIKRNESRIAINADYLIFTATDSCRDVTIGDDPYPYQDIPVSGKLFEPFIYKFDTGSFQKLPDRSKWNGLIYFVYEGETRKGFIQDIEKYHIEQQSSWILRMVK